LNTLESMIFILMFVALSISTAACTGSGGSDTDASADGAGDVHWPTGGDADADADMDGDTPAGDGGGYDPPTACQPDACVPRDMEITKQEAFHYPRNDTEDLPRFVSYWGHENYSEQGGSPRSDGILRIEIYPETTGVELEPVEVQLTGNETQYATCGHCVRYFDDVEYDSEGELSNENSIVFYMACEGRLEIDEIVLDAGPDAEAYMSGVLSANFVEVTIDDFYISKEVEDADSFCIENIAFEAPLVTLQQ